MGHIKTTEEGKKLYYSCQCQLVWHAAVSPTLLPKHIFPSHGAEGTISHRKESDSGIGTRVGEPARGAGRTFWPCPPKRAHANTRRLPLAGPPRSPALPLDQKHFLCICCPVSVPFFLGGGDEQMQNLFRETFGLFSAEIVCAKPSCR